MGCDVTGFIEQQDAGGFWDLTSDFAAFERLLGFDGRCYFLWALVADVRNSWGIAPIAADRGLPPDVSDAGRECYYRSLKRHREWLHSTTWITLAELRDHDFGQPVPHWRRPSEPVPRTVGDVLGEDYVSNLRGVCRSVGDPCRLRAVLWFDN